MMRFVSAACVLGLVLVGCGGSSSSDGSGGGGGGGGSGGGAATAGTGASAGVAGTAGDTSLIGTWVGYVEAHQFTSGSDAVVLTITGGAPTGSIVFGNGSPPPPPTSGEVGYPPGFDPINPLGMSFGVDEGFAYSLRQASVTGDRVKATVSVNELWEDWCPLVTPYEWGEGYYACLPNWGFSSGSDGCSQTDPDTGQKVKRDCGKLALCSTGDEVCSCTAQGCTVAVDASPIRFDLDHQGNELDGSVEGLSGGVKTVRLTKQ